MKDEADPVFRLAAVKGSFRQRHCDEIDLLDPRLHRRDDLAAPELHGHVRHPDDGVAQLSADQECSEYGQTDEE